MLERPWRGGVRSGEQRLAARPKDWSSDSPRGPPADAKSRGFVVAERGTGGALPGAHEDATFGAAARDRVLAITSHACGLRAGAFARRPRLVLPVLDDLRDRRPARGGDRAAAPRPRAYRL